MEGGREGGRDWGLVRESNGGSEVGCHEGSREVVR